MSRKRVETANLNHQIQISTHQNFNEAWIAYTNAITALVANAVTHASMITAAVNTGHFNEAWIAYTNAITAGVADAVTHNSMITAAGNTGHFNEALIAYTNAITAGVANAVTHASMITAAGNCNRIDLVEEAYMEALRLGIANVVTHGNFIDAQIKTGFKLSVGDDQKTRYQNDPYRLFSSKKYMAPVNSAHTQQNRLGM